MTHIFIGTKAQYIKTAPLIRYLDRCGTPYNLIDSGQHAELTTVLRQELGIREPDVRLRQGTDISTPWQAFVWLIHQLGRCLFKKRWILEHVFRATRGVCVIHGDTPSTLLSVLFAKRAGLEVAHIEAGLRSHSYFHPFPEELIRVIVMKMADLLFAPTPLAYRNLSQMDLARKAVCLPANTNIEAIEYALLRPSRRELPPKPYAVATLHRAETILREGAMEKAIELIARASSYLHVVFVLHSATTIQLRKTNLLAQVCHQHDGIQCCDLMPHADFIHLLNGAEFVLTDGGSIQEECYYLGKPCLLLRKRTEREEGLGQNVLLSAFADDIAEEFYRNYSSYRRPAVTLDQRPSQIIALCIGRMLSGQNINGAVVRRESQQQA